MELRVLRYFLAVAEEESVTAAARRVRVAQPSLSRQLRGLEADLGVDLFTRRPGSLTLSAAGQRFRPIARDLVRRAEQAAETMAAAGRGASAALTVVAAPSTVTYLLAPFMAGGGGGADLRDAVQEEPSKVFETLLRSDADFGISTIPAPAPLESAFLGRTPVIAQVPPDHPWAGRSAVDLADLVTEPLILMTRSNVARLVVDEAISRAGLVPAGVSETGSSAFAQALSAAGRGVCLVTDHARFGLTELLVRTHEGALTVPLYAGWDTGHYARPAILEMVEGLREYCAHELNRIS
ncbi:LysR family transcriptional regulator [Streptomyces sp. OR43]|uniref:LysR family transcriptional regulator n=1 Tax=Streptomyces sp. or43 TaxID=2478957 RepID=UPI0011CE1FC7|nr:LysR family transcriptional regulator [Streptomyces sp. or43]TXS42219.1 LysR family transcriptional regulator [Streptomyces sp. or43]